MISQSNIAELFHVRTTLFVIANKLNYHTVCTHYVLAMFSYVSFTDTHNHKACN